MFLEKKLFCSTPILSFMKLDFLNCVSLKVNNLIFNDITIDIKKESFSEFSSKILFIIESFFLTQFNDYNIKFSPPKLILWEGKSTTDPYGKKLYRKDYAISFSVDNSIYINVGELYKESNIYGCKVSILFIYLLSHEYGHIVISTIIKNLNRITKYNSEVYDILGFLYYLKNNYFNINKIDSYSHKYINTKFEGGSDYIAGIFFKFLINEYELNESDLEILYKTLLLNFGDKKTNGMSHGTGGERLSFLKDGMANGHILGGPLFDDFINKFKKTKNHLL